MLSGFIQLSPFDVLQTYTASYTQDVPTSIGDFGITSDGRRFRFGFNNTASTSLAAAKLAQGPAVVSGQQGGTVSAQAIGDTQITVTFGSGQTIAANFYSGGFINIITGTGSVAQYQIKGHGATTSSTTLILNLFDPIVTATSAAATANLWPNPYTAAIICPTTLTGSVLGVNMVAIAAQYYGWFQTAGISTCLNQGGTTAGLGLAPSSSVAGALATVAATTNQVAVADQAGTDTAYGFVRMQID